MFGDNIGLDPVTNGADGYGSVEHFTFDFSKPVGEEAKLEGYTVNRYKYPDDSRLIAGISSTGYIRYYNGQKFLITHDGDVGTPLSIYRFNVATDGEVAIPCIFFENGNLNFKKAPKGSWIWRDKDGDGQMDSNEFVSTEFSASGGGYCGFVDNDMTLWFAFGNIKKSDCLGMDSFGIPIFNLNYETIARPSPYTDIHRAKYYPQHDVMYLSGLTTAFPTQNNWKAMGRVLSRYNNWSTGNRIGLYQIIVPFNNDIKDCESISFDVADDYIFTAIARKRKNVDWGQINVYNAKDGSGIGIMKPAWYSIGWMDMTQCLAAIKRQNGEYVITVEDDFRNKQFMYRWCPGGNCSQNTVKVNGVSIVPISKNLLVGQSVVVLANISPSNASNNTVIWCSSNPKVASISTSGVLKGLTEGKTTITATTVDGKILSHIQVIVEFKSIKSVMITTALKSLCVHEKKQLTAIVTPANASNKKIVWSSSDTTVLKVIQNGLISAIAEGNANITVTSEDRGIAASLKLTIVPLTPGTWITVDDNEPGWIWDGFYFKACGRCFGASYHSANNTNATAQYSFTGTNIEAHCETWDDGGDVEIFIDGELKGTFTQSLKPYMAGSKFASINGLKNGAHIVKFVSNSKKWIGIDYVRYAIGISKDIMLTK